MKKKKILLAGWCVLIFLYSGSRVFSYWQENRREQQLYTQLRTEQGDSQQQTSDEALPQVDFAALSQINGDVVGWLYCPDTPLDYPVVQGEDNAYYLDHYFDGREGSAGCLFLDCRNESDFSDFHSIIYGHQMKNGTMFASLEEYQSQTYYEDHPELYLLTPEKNYRIKVFAGYVASVQAEAWQLDFSSLEERENWLEKALEQSTFISGIMPSPQERIVTLSTCSSAFADARYVLLGILEAESLS